MKRRFLAPHSGSAFRAISAAALFLALIAWSLPIAPGWALAQSTSTGQAPQRSIADIVDDVGSAVVTVYNLDIAQGATSQDAALQGIGSGFIIDEEGHVVTNWHVVTGGEAFTVLFSDGTSVEATLVGEDPRDDLAVVKIDPKNVPAVVKFGDSDALRPGEAVIAIGSPLGAFSNTVTEGIVSGLGRDQFGASASICQNYADLIQHDAAINPGNSGGPLFNMAGEVIGVNTLGLPTDMNGQPVQGLFFAVPGNLVKDVAGQLIRNGRISASFLGIKPIPIDPSIAAQNDLPVDQGVYVQDIINGGPADEGGLQPGDIITAVDGVEITLGHTLANISLDYQPGDKVTLAIIRDGNEQTVEVTFGEAPDNLLEQCILNG